MAHADDARKLEHLQTLLTFHGLAFLHVTPGPQARLPGHLSGRQSVPLILTTECELHADEWGFTATLVFGRKQHYVSVPWGLVWSIVDERQHGVVYSEAGFPRAEVIDFFDARRTAKRGAGRRPSKPAKRPGYLRVV